VATGGSATSGAGGQRSGAAGNTSTGGAEARGGTGGATAIGGTSGATGGTGLPGTGGRSSGSGGRAPTGGTGPRGGAGTGPGGTAAGGGGGFGTGGTGGAQDPATLELMESVVFYDGYANTSDEPVPDGIVRLDNSVLTTRLSEEQLSLIQPHLELSVTMGALCDNYDRIGSVRLAFVPKGSQRYDPEAVTRIELARFITPFMDKNRMPDTVPYVWDIDNVSAILTDPQLRNSYDFWMELSVFGVPYAANEEVAGCAGRSDVFRGWLSLATDSSVEPTRFDVLLPLACNEPFNDYQVGASDRIGVTRKTIEFSLDENAEDAEIFLITSNHGANSGGEEYIRREHFVFVDGEQKLSYRPGRTSCEPFRRYNTQANGIYGQSPRSDQEWQSFSNWCPGDKLDIRVVPCGALAAGAHEFVIDVPDAVFAGDDGNFPLSLYLQAR
jgi:hypothetical protein